MIRAGYLTKNTDENIDTVFRPQLTSLIDVMTFLLVFLIKSFSVDGDIVTPASNLQLPLSTSVKKPQPSLSLEVTHTAVMCEGRVLADLVSRSPRDSLLMPGIYNWMLLRKAQRADTLGVNHNVLIQADREIEFSLLKRIMYSCSKAGFSDFTILAVKKE